MHNKQRKPHDHPDPDKDAGPPAPPAAEDVWAYAARTGDYGAPIRVLTLKYIERRVNEITQQLASARPYDPGDPYDPDDPWNSGLSDSARAALQADLDRYQAALAWQAKQ